MRSIIIGQHKNILLVTLALATLAAAPKPKAAAKPVQENAPHPLYYLKSYSLPSSHFAGTACAGLLPATENKALTAEDYRTILGEIPPFSFRSRGPRQLLLYTSNPTQKDRDSQISFIDSRVDSLRSAGRFQAEFKVPHSAAAGNLLERIAALNASDFIVESVGRDAVRITAESVPDCEDWTELLKQIRRLAWAPTPVQPVARVFYLDAAAVAKALNGTPAAAPAAPATKKDADDAEEKEEKPDSAKKQPPKPPAPSPLAPSTTATAAQSDVLIFSEPVPGDDASVEEKRRIISMLDLPQPEMIVNVWSSQISSPNQDLVSNFSRKFRFTVSHSNDELQKSIAFGWLAVKNYYANQPARFNQQFYRYVSYRYVLEPVQNPASASLTTRIEDFLNYRGNLSISAPQRAALGICPAAEYCLGYTDLFHPLKPKLVDLLLALIAAQDPLELLAKGVNAMEGGPLKLTGSLCEDRDRSAYAGTRTAPVFACFREQATTRLAATTSPTPQGLLQSAIADFLFNYKMASQFPHEFSPYRLSQSANQLNAALAPLIDAFNRDIAVFQTAMTDRVVQHGLEPQGKDSWTASDVKRKKFENYGVVTVRTVSGKETIVDTATQSYLDVTNAPTIPELLSSIKSAESNVPGVLSKNTSVAAAAALEGALNTTQTTESKSGRGLKIKISPRSLPGASSAELDIAMNVEESAEPSLYTAGKASTSNDNLSRVAKHNTTTKMRVESLRIFEVSSFSAKLLRSRPRFPLLPLPGLEIPYVGSLVGFPRSPAAEYHNSVAVLSAIVVPTAADLAYGSRYEADRILIPASEESDFCRDNKGLEGCTRHPSALNDLQDVHRFHQRLINCLSTNWPTAIHAFATSAAQECTP